MCAYIYYKYPSCGHVIFQEQQKCGYWIYHGHCDLVGEEYEYEGKSCPLCYYERKAAEEAAQSK